MKYNIVSNGVLYNSIFNSRLGLIDIPVIVQKPLCKYRNYTFLTRVNVCVVVRTIILHFKSLSLYFCLLVMCKLYYFKNLRSTQTKRCNG